MDKDGVIAWVIGILVAVCIVLLAIGPVVYLRKHGLAAFETGKVDGADQWDERAARDVTDNTGRKATARDLGLESRYEVVPFFSDTRDRLYAQHDYATVEARLAEQFEKRSDPYEAHLYGRKVARLSYLNPEDDPEVMLAVLDAWVAASPSSYRARLVRGQFRIRYGWYYRGDGLMKTVSASSRQKFVEQLGYAREDLDDARSMNPGDPEIPVHLGTIAMALGEGHQATERCFRDAIAASPLSLSARIMRVNAALPKWGGSWEEVDAVLGECDMSSQQFPLLQIARREGEKEMGSRSPGHKTALSSDRKRKEWAAPYLAQLERNPDDPLLMTNAAYFSVQASDFAAADPLFHKLGDRYHEGANFQDLLEYHNFRAKACAAAGHPMPAAGAKP